MLLYLSIPRVLEDLVEQYTEPPASLAIVEGRKRGKKRRRRLTAEQRARESVEARRKWRQTTGDPPLGEANTDEKVPRPVLEKSLKKVVKSNQVGAGDTHCVAPSMLLSF